MPLLPLGLFTSSAPQLLPAQLLCQSIHLHASLFSQRMQVEVLLALRGTLNVGNLEAVYEDDTHVHLVCLASLCPRSFCRMGMLA